MVQDFDKALTRYNFLVETLDQMTTELEIALKGDQRWFSFGPRIARKFLNQAYSLGILLSPKVLDQINETDRPIEDISSMYSLLRMQFETHAAYYHFFVPAQNIEENILRFRLWELDGLRSRLKFKRQNVSLETQELINKDIAYILIIENAIKSLSYYQSLPIKQQDELLKKSLWKFTDESLMETEKSKWGNSFSRLILNTGLKQDIHDDLYNYLSMHTHPQYIGVIQNKLTEEERDMMYYVAVMNSCFVTAFIIEDLAKRYVQPKDYLKRMDKTKFEVYESILQGGRNI